MDRKAGWIMSYRFTAIAMLALAGLSPACGRAPAPAVEADSTSVVTTPGAEAVQAVEAQNALTSTPVPTPPVGVIGEAREAADAANAQVQAMDSLVQGL